MTIVAAMAENRVIGARGAIPWSLPREIRHARGLTDGHFTLVGRKTYERAIDDFRLRRPIVLTATPTRDLDGDARAVGSVSEAIRVAGELDETELMVCGGARTYAAALPFATRLALTIIHARPEGDTQFPRWNPTGWKEVGRQFFLGDDENPLAITILRLERPGTTTRRPGSII